MTENIVHIKKTVTAGAVTVFFDMHNRNITTIKAAHNCNCWNKCIFLR